MTRTPKEETARYGKERKTRSLKSALRMIVVSAIFILLLGSRGGGCTMVGSIVSSMFGSTPADDDGQLTYVPARVELMLWRMEKPPWASEGWSDHLYFEYELTNTGNEAIYYINEIVLEVDHDDGISRTTHVYGHGYAMHENKRYSELLTPIPPGTTVRRKDWHYSGLYEQTLPLRVQAVDCVARGCCYEAVD